MKNDIKKIVLVGAGFVGTSFAYVLLNQIACDELILIDIDTRCVGGEAVSLNHGVVFSGSHMKIYAGTYSDCKDADIVAICADAAWKPGETCIDLLQRNTAVFRSVVDPVVDFDFDGIFLTATSPVDIMAHVTQKFSRFDPHRVVGFGTMLDNTCLCHLLDSYLGTDPRSAHAYVMGEHGDSEFVPWLWAMVGTKSVPKIVGESPEKFSLDDLQSTSEEAKNAVQETTTAKKPTYYGVGTSMVWIAKAIFDDEDSIPMVSTLLNGEHGGSGVYIGVPCFVNREGIAGILEVPLTEKEFEKFKLSSDVLKDAFGGIHFGE